MAVLEAMACGLPVVTTPVGAVPDFVKNNINGFLVTPGDSAQIEQGITTLLDRGELRALMSRNNLEYVIHNYAIEHVVPAFAEAFKTITISR